MASLATALLWPWSRVKTLACIFLLSRTPFEFIFTTLSLKPLNEYQKFFGKNKYSSSSRERKLFSGVSSHLKYFAHIL